MTGPDLYLTVDAEPDCPPYLWTWRGMEEGMPRLLDLLAKEGVPATFFTTGQAAERHPGIVEAVVRAGHELGSHGQTHQRFSTFDAERARREITGSNRILRQFAPVAAFRAPYLDFPERFLPLLAEDGIALDASPAKYKPRRPGKATASAPVRRLAASATSSVLRLPALLRDPWLKALRSPVVLFVHPWEFVDLRKSTIRLDCRFRTGPGALRGLGETIALFKRAGANFRRASDYLSAPAADSTSR